MKKAEIKLVAIQANDVIATSFDMPRYSFDQNQFIEGNVNDAKDYINLTWNNRQ